MALAVRCLNADCGRATQLGEDPLGRVFRCPHCRTKLPSSSGTPAIRTPDLGAKASVAKATRSAAAAASLAAGASAAWNHPVPISTWESSLLEDGCGGSGEVLIGAFRPAENTGRVGLERVRSGIVRTFGVAVGASVGTAESDRHRHVHASDRRSDRQTAGGTSVAEFEFDFDDEDDEDEVSCVHVPPFSGASAASWNGSSPDFRFDSSRDRDLNRTAGAEGSSSDLTRLERFRILGVLGEGAKATVYRAHDPLLDRDVALKVPRPGTVKTPKAAARFLAEAKALARLRHPRIVPVFEAGQAGGVSYIALALVEGQTLADVLADGAVEPRRGADIVRGLAEALAYAHSQGVVHRDVKPANIRVDAQGDVYLMDFGIAYLPDSGEMPVPPGVILGTPAYVAPEQAKGGQPDVLPASDQYSLGAVLYELLCGRPPFSGPPSYVLFHTIHQEPPSPRTIDSQIPRALASICLKALAKQPEDRYASCQEFADDLRRWLNRETPSAVRRSSWSLRTG